ncbi:pentatricopeptide repeat-containing protein At1g76280 [Cornus florida]|uniref:pentatricopeptide repeat-containing protein At1g76280 n=1 Tax=Cornus florida TaxID=4283 RepID=UPI002898AE5E|nr:pentatricopeptide repeat-containing protein At1g76280 [Cornus florida]
MRRSLLTIRLQSIAQSFCKSKRQKTVADKLENFRAFTTSTGRGCLGYEGKPFTRSVQVQIVNALRWGERSRASSLLLNLGCGNRSLRADDFLYILEYCSRSPDPLFVMETWRIMGEQEVDIDEKSYLLIIRALCKGGYLVEAFNLINVLGENHDIYPILPMYNNFLGACARMNSLNHANDCLDLMESKLAGKNEVTHAELLKLAVLQQNLSAVHGIWKEYIKNYSPSIISLRKFVWSFTSLRDLESAYEILQHMVALAFRGGFVIAKTSEGKLYTSRLDIPIPSNNHWSLKRCSKENENFEISIQTNCKEIDTHTSTSGQCAVLCMGRKEVENFGPSMLKKHISVPVMKILRWAFNDVIRGCAQTLNCRLAEQLILQMQNLGVELSCNTYDGFMRAIVSEKGFHEGLEMLKVMQQKDLKPYDSTLATISVGCSKSLELNLAEALLDQISKSPSVYPYNAFLEACDRLDQPERAVQILAKMKQMKLHPDIRTYELLFSLFGNVNAPYEVGNMLSQVEVAKRIHAIELDMEKYGIQHSLLSMKNLLKALGAEGMTREMIQYLRMAENQFSLGNSYLGTLIYNTVLHSLVEAKESRSALEIFKTMKSCGFVPDAATYTIMIDCCSIIRCFKTACALVSMMVRDGFYLQAATYTALLKILLGCEDFNGALDLLDQGNLDGIQPDVLLFNTILQKACEKGRIDIIELIVERMHQEKIQPDPSTCSFVFSAYVDRGFDSTAVEALQVLSMRMISEEDVTLEEKRMEYEEAFILAEDLDAESRILELFKDSEEKIAAALLNLRWCAIAGFPVSWSPNQTLWATRLSSNVLTNVV